MSLVIYHNPSCATSRKVLGLIRAAGIEPEIVLYLKEPPSKEVLLDLLARLKLSPRAILRRRGTPYDDLGLGDPALSDTALINAMVRHPILIERPIVVTETTGRLCRPPECVLDLLSGGALPAPAEGKADQLRPKKSGDVSSATVVQTRPQKTLLFRASLDAKHFREFEIGGTAKLDDLAAAIVTIFGFDFDHAFGFYSKLTGHIYDSPVKYELFADIGDADGDSRSVKKTKIVAAFPAPGTKMAFLFDYGDEWLFMIEMIGEGKKDPELKYPHVVKSVGKAPKQYPKAEE